MGASKYKKVRNEERSSGVVSAREAAAQEAQKAQKKTRTLTIVGIAALVLLTVAVILINSSFFDTRCAALKIGDTSYSAAEVRYAKQTAYNNFLNSYGELAGYFLDTSAPLDEQSCAFNPEISWNQYFLEQGIDYLKQTTALYNAAKAEGRTLSEEDAAVIESNMNMIGLYASAYGYSVDGYIAALYGEGNSEKTMRSMMERSLVASAYAAEKSEEFSSSFTDAELEEYYKENRDSYSTVSYLTAQLPFETDEEGNPVSEEEKTAAKASADAILAACDGTAESFRAAVLAETGAEAIESGSVISNAGDASEWFASAERKEGDVTSVEESTCYRVYCYQSFDDNTYKTVSARHILVQVVDADEDGIFSDEEKQGAKETIEAIRDEWDGTEENFIELVGKYSEDPGSVDNGGLYENIYHNQMVPEFNDFVFSGAKSGDSAIVYGESSSYAGYHLVYFVGEGDTYAHVLSRNALSDEAFSSWQEELMNGYEPEQAFMFRYV